MGKNEKLIKLIRSLEALVLEYKFDEASELLVDLDELTITSVIDTSGHDKPGVLAYVFVSFLLKKEEKAIYHNIASILMSGAFNYLPGAYLASYYHSKRAIKLDPSNIGYKNTLLFLRQIPEKILEKEEAVQLAKEILNEKPDSDSALGILIWENIDVKDYIEKALRYNPDNVNIKETILLYYSKIKKFVSKELVLQLAADVLENNPKSDAAQRVIKELT